MGSPNRGNGGGKRPLYSLSPRQLDVVRLVCQDRSDKEIAAILGIAEDTVGNHLAAVYGELKVHSRVGLYRFALQQLELLELGWTNDLLHAIGCRCDRITCKATRAGLGDPS